MPLSFEQAVKLQDTYRPRDAETVRQLETILLAPFVGPTAVGKNYLMTQLAASRNYHQVGNLMTRELRADDPPNVEHRDEGQMLADIEHAKLVQYAAHIGSRAIYGTTIASYAPDRINVKDIFAHSIDGFMAYGFKAVRPVCVLVPAREWEPRLDERFKSLTPEQRAARLDEAEQSIQWILNGSAEVRRVMVISDEYRPSEAVQRIQAFVEEDIDTPPEQIHFDTAESMIELLPKLRKKYDEKG